ncbi:MAG: hypothetical protein IPP97_23330 [Candidatus Obscuribacter sp.]|nr:hypothetical protein [Candidatus Obscuribacter sp.]
MGSNYFIEIIVAVALLTALKPLLLHRHQNAEQKPEELVPVEVAYLSRGGDRGFALLVLLFDLVHREVKEMPDNLLESGLSLIADQDLNTADPLSQRIISSGYSYDAGLKAMVKKALQDWGTKKVESIVDINIKKNPIGFIKRLPFLFKLLRNGLFDTIKEILKDPKKLRRYVSLPGLMRLAAEIGASGYKDDLARELAKALTDRGLLLTTKERKGLAGYFVSGFVIGELTFAFILSRYMGDHWQAFWIFVFAFAGSLFVRATLFAREFIPLYRDLMDILAQTKNSNWRVRALTIFLNLVNIILGGLSIIAYLVVFALGSLILYVTHTVNDFGAYLVLTSLLLAHSTALGWLLEAHRLYFSDCPSLTGELALDKLRHTYSGRTSVNALKSMLATRQYHPEMSYLLALYGPETLLFL